MKYITTKVIPLAAPNYPCVQMVLMMDNAPFHHVCGIPSLTRFSNNITIKLMEDHRINYMLLLLTNEQIGLLTEQ